MIHRESGRQRERERQINRQTHRHTQTDRHRQIDRQTDTDTHRQTHTDRQTDRQRKKEREGMTGTKNEREIDRDKIRVITINEQLVNFNSSFKHRYLRSLHSLSSRMIFYRIQKDFVKFRITVSNCFICTSHYMNRIIIFLLFYSYYQHSLNNNIFILIMTFRMFFQMTASYKSDLNYFNFSFILLFQVAGKSMSFETGKMGR